MSLLAVLLTSWEFYAALCVIFAVSKVIIWLTDPLRNIPGPAGYPIIGNTFSYSNDGDRHRILLDMGRKYGKICKDYTVFTGTTVFINDPEFAKQILVTNSSSYRRDDVLLKLLPALGTGLLTTSGKVHAAQRKTLNPAFSLSSVRKFISIFNEKGSELLQFYEKEIEQNKGEPIEMEMMKKFTDMTLDVIGLSAFGYNFNCVLRGNSKESEASSHILSGSFNILRKSFEELFPPLKIVPSKERDMLRDAEKISYGLIEKVIKSRREEMATHPGETLDKNDLLQILITMYEDAGTTISNKDLFHQLFTFMLAGHETTSLTFTWTIFLLAKHQEFQERVKKEVREVLNGATDVTFDDIDKMKTLDECIKETMRLYPVVISYGRRSLKEDKLGPYTIPPGTNFLINVSALHQNPKYWKNPDEFNPDRFSKQAESDPLFPYYYLPFSRGPRMCIGYRFAMLELKIVLALLLNKFSFKLGKSQPAEIKGQQLLTYRPCPPPVINISKS